MFYISSIIVQTKIQVLIPDSPEVPSILNDVSSPLHIGVAKANSYFYTFKLCTRSIRFRQHNHLLYDW